MRTHISPNLFDVGTEHRVMCFGFTFAETKMIVEYARRTGKDMRIISRDLIITVENVVISMEEIREALMSMGAKITDILGIDDVGIIPITEEHLEILERLEKFDNCVVKIDDCGRILVDGKVWTFDEVLDRLDECGELEKDGREIVEMLPL